LRTAIEREGDELKKMIETGKKYSMMMGDDVIDVDNTVINSSMYLTISVCQNVPDCFRNGRCAIDSGRCQYEPVEGYVPENQCYEVSCKEEKWVIKERSNVTRWKEQSNGCVIYECDNETGQTSTSICESVGDVVHVCKEGMCVVEQTPEDKPWIVEIDVTPEIGQNETDINGLAETVANISGVERASISIGYETDEHGNVIKVFVYIDSNENAMLLAQAIQEIKKTCQ